MSDDGAFLEILAGCTDACANMDLNDDNWNPPDGPYDVVVEGVTSDTKEKGGVLNAWIKSVFTILDGEFKGRSFGDYFWIEPGMVEPSISIRNLCKYATCLQGSETRDPVEAAEIARASTGEFLNIEVYRTTSKKTRKVYANKRYCQRLAATEVDFEVDAEVTE